MAKPTSGHTAAYSSKNVESAPDGRLFSRVFERNSPPIIAALSRLIGDKVGRALEIGCGTGQHAAACQLAFPNLEWIASDLYPQHRASADAWRAYFKLPSRPAIDVDAATDWAKEVAGLAPLRAIVAMNVIHIAPWSVAQGIIKGAAATLTADGMLIFYGPFRIDGAHIGDGNAAFDRGLRADNPDWGVRDTADIEKFALKHGLSIQDIMPMPANNRMISLRKTSC